MNQVLAFVGQDKRLAEAGEMKIGPFDPKHPELGGNGQDSTSAWESNGCEAGGVVVEGKTFPRGKNQITRLNEKKDS